MFLYWMGMIIGSLITALVFLIRYHYAGTLRIDHSNSEKDVYRFEIDNLDRLSKKHRIVLKVDNNADLSQK